MLRRIRFRLRPPLPPLDVSRAIALRTSSAVAYKVREEEPEQDVEVEPYGTEYGAGPSRIPYQPPQFRAHQQHLHHAVHNLHTSPPIPSYKDAHILRKRLRELPHGVYAHFSPFLRKALASEPTNANLEQSLRSLTRLELATILHHLLRESKGNLAAALIREVITVTPRMKRRRLFHTRTIATVFTQRSDFNLKSARAFVDIQPPPNTKPSLAEQVSPSPSLILGTLVDILEALQDVRFRRTTEMYRLVIRQCLEELQPDLAAKIYVGLVEEWVTEGRVAEGADPEDFHPGGGPPREEILNRRRVSAMLARWWTGVRTWRFPGEVLSPHDRMDLWHPRHLSLGEKMRNFPFPLASSPPSIVPQPDSNMLNMILSTLTLDSTKVSPAQFASSVRALAILANTVLSRTLPISSLGGLLQAFNAVPYKPDVFPDDITSRPTSNAWAYTAFTQIHVTLMSLVFSPPISADSIRMIEAHEQQQMDIQMAPDADTDRSSDPDVQVVAETKSHESVAPPVSPYMLPPLSWPSSRIMLYYTLKRLRAPAALKSLVRYIKGTFGMGGSNPALYNVFLEVGTLLRDNRLAQQAEIILFGPQPQSQVHSHAPATSPPRVDERAYFSSRRVGIVHKQTSSLELDITPVPGADPVADERSLVQLLHRLTATSQFDRLVEMVYRLIPFLDFTSSMTAEEVDGKRMELGLAGEGRPASDPALTPDIYAAILDGLAKAGKTGLAQRVFTVALRAEAQAVDQFVTTRKGPVRQNITVPESLRLPIAAFTSMMRVWENEYQAARRSRSQEQYRTRLGWAIPKRYIDLPWDAQAAQMAWITHDLVKERYKHRAGRGALKEEYYDALIRACAGRWALDVEHKSPSRSARQEMSDVAYHMRKGGLEVPPILAKRLAGDLGGKIPSSRSGLWSKRKTAEEEDEEKEARDAPAELLKRMMGRE